MTSCHICVVLLCIITTVASISIQRSSEDPSMNFIVMGDWGGLPIFPYYSPFEKATAAAMAMLAKNQSSQLVFALGDNFYYDGVTDENDPRFKTTFEDVFNQKALLDIDWFLVAGNHDHYGNISAQIAYSAHSKRWKFPDLWYQVDIIKPTFNVSVIMIDTVVLCGNTGADGEVIPLTRPESYALANKQLMYIEQELKKSAQYTYVLVMGHFPVLSIAEHGPTQCLIDLLDPLLVKYKVSAYFCGHDHNLQHLKSPSSGMNYFVTGAVDVVDPSMKHAQNVPEGSLLYHFNDILGLGGFSSVDVDANRMVVSFHDAGHPEKVLYSYKILPRH